MRFIIADSHYIKIKKTTLDVWMTDSQQSGASKLLWNLEIEAEGWVSFSCEGLYFPTVQEAKDVVGHAIAWDIPINPITRGMNGSWYRNAHHEILQATLHFLEMQEGQIRIIWEGICSEAPLGCEPRDEERLPFSIDCWCVLRES